ncbi:MAG: TfoX/Sxy family protein [Fimbriimonadaceae bacterium]
MPKPLKDPDAQRHLDLLNKQTPTTARAMFGGYGYYSEGGPVYAIFAIDKVYFKVDDANRHHFEEAGQGPFIFDMGGKPGVMQYYSIPAEDWSTSEKLHEWITLGQQAADRAAAKKDRKSKKI